jgi:hypothetical protein
MKTRIESLTKVNDVEIQIVETETGYFIPVRPICDALEVNFSGQSQRIKRDKILKSVSSVMKATGADGKRYKMFCISLKFVLSWLFTVDVNRVKKEALEAVINRQMQYYTKFVEQKQIKIMNPKPGYSNSSALPWTILTCNADS